jgi:hypothetical protein
VPLVGSTSRDTQIGWPGREASSKRNNHRLTPARPRVCPMLYDAGIIEFRGFERKR